jgi:hypothetical protein
MSSAFFYSIFPLTRDISLNAFGCVVALTLFIPVVREGISSGLIQLIKKTPRQTLLWSLLKGSEPTCPHQTLSKTNRTESLRSLTRSGWLNEGKTLRLILKGLHFNLLEEKTFHLSNVLLSSSKSLFQ